MEARWSKKHKALEVHNFSESFVYQATIFHGFIMIQKEQ